MYVDQITDIAWWSCGEGLQINYEMIKIDAGFEILTDPQELLCYVNFVQNFKKNKTLKRYENI